MARNAKLGLPGPMLLSVLAVFVSLGRLSRLCQSWPSLSVLAVLGLPGPMLLTKMAKMAQID